MMINLNTATGTQALWMQERIILRGYGQGYAPLYIWTNLHGSQAAPLARYEQAGSLTYADITDYVRAYPNVSKIYYTDDLSPDTTPQELSVQVVGRVNPANDFIPQNCEAIMINSRADAAGLLVSPPSKILQAIGVAIPTVAEVRIRQGQEYMQRYSTQTTGVVFDEQDNTIEIANNVTVFSIWDDDEQEEAMTYQITARDAERDYLALRWVSRYGVTKQFVWEMRGLKYATQDAVEIENLNNEFDTRKGFLLSFTARQDRLTAYDYWYYADIINSSDVQAYYNGQWRKVAVDTKDVTIPNASAGEFKTLEITIKFARYDAI